MIVAFTSLIGYRTFGDWMIAEQNRLEDVLAKPEQESTIEEDSAMHLLDMIF
jgi:hypothetical protein